LLKHLLAVAAVSLALSACERSPLDEDMKITYGGELYPENKLILDNGMYYFGDTEGLDRPPLQNLFRHDRNCIDAGMVAFALNEDVAECGSYHFEFERDGAAITAKGICVRDVPDKCVPNSSEPTQITYSFVSGRLPDEFLFEVVGMYRERFTLLN
jgi:hypothetical protein